MTLLETAIVLTGGAITGDDAETLKNVDVRLALLMNRNATPAVLLAMARAMQIGAERLKMAETTLGFYRRQERAERTADDIEYETAVAAERRCVAGN